MGLNYSTLRADILSYKPGKAVPCDDVVFPSQLVIGVINVRGTLSTAFSMVSTMRCALLSVHADQHDTSTEGQKKKLTDFISVIEKTRHQNLDGLEGDVEDLAAEVGCFLFVMDADEYGREAINKIRKITGRRPIVATRSVSEERLGSPRIGLHNRRVQAGMYERGIASDYEIPNHDKNLTETEKKLVFNLLRGCLREGDVILASNYFKGILRNERLLYERAKKEATEAKQKMTEEVRHRERADETLQQEIKKSKVKLEESSESHRSLANDNARLKNEIVREKEKREKAELAMTENDKLAKNSQEMYKQRVAKLREELKTTEQHIKAQKAKHKEREETARREVERIKKQKEEERERAEKEKISMTMLAEQLKKEVESNKRRVNSLAKLVEEREQDKATLKQQVNCLEMKIEEERARLEKENLSVELALKNKLKSEKECVEQLERETWKLRTKIQLESEIRSEEKKMKAETSQWSFLPWISSGKQTQTGTSLSEDPSNRGSRGSYEMQAGKELPDDEFADILKQIANDLYDEAKIDSLGSQLGILQGDIQRALMTNVRFNRVTSEGTRHMLKQWRSGVSREDERIELRRALEAAKLLDLAENYLPKELAVEASAPLSPERERRDDEEYDTATEGTKVEGTNVQSDKQDSQQHESVHHVGGVRDEQPSQSVIRDVSDGTESFGRLVVAESSAGKFHCSEVAVGSAAAAATSTSDNQNQNDEVSDAPTSQTMAEHMEVQGVQEYLQKQGSNDCVVNSPDIYVADGQMEDEQHQASQAHDSTALLDESDSSSEGRCCSWCCLPSNSGQ